MAIADTFTLSRLEQIRALSDPLRLRMVEALVAREEPVAGLARALDVPATRLYHHVDLLHEAGLIEITRRVRRRGGEERFYRAVARQYQLDGDLLSFDATDGQSTEELVELARSVLGSALEQLTDALRSGRAGPGSPHRTLVLEDRELRLSAEGAAALAKELPAWLDGFARRHTKPRGAPCRLVVAAFPATGRGGRPRGPASARRRKA